MLCSRLSAVAFVHASCLRLKHSPAVFILSSPSRSKSFSVKMSAHMIEHVVLFNVRDDVEASKINSMVTELSSLASLDQVQHLTTGSIHSMRSSSFIFTHILHSRYRTKEDLSAYSLHPKHLSVVRQFVLPICSDIFAIDWISQGIEGTAAIPQPGSALRFQLLKIKEGLGNAEKGQILEAINEIKDICQNIDQISVGENFSPDRAKGFSLASVAMFPSLKDLESLNGEEEAIKLLKEKARDFIDTVIVVDYVIPQAQHSGL